MKENIITIETDNKEREYSVYISNSFNQFYHIYKEAVLEKGKVFLITDDNIEKLYLPLIEGLKDRLGCKVFTMEHGEQNKNFNVINNIYEFLLNNDCDRNSTLIALGGGVVGDMAGFVAATYMRGILYINIPTTLISQVDSSVGGKTGFNFSGIKNCIGCFYNPSLVYIATDFLNTLSKDELLNGIGEVIKYGLIKDNDFYQYIEYNLNSHMSLKEDMLSNIINNCLEFKGRVICEDYTDKGKRNILNFGHTVGHGLEAVSQYKLPHGIAVALGILVSIKLSEIKFNLDKEVYITTKRIYKKIGIQTNYKVDNFPSFLYAINHDKKNFNQLNFILLRSIGSCEIKVPVSEEELLWALKNSILED